MLQGLCPAGKWEAQTNHVEGVEQPIDDLGRIFRMVRGISDADRDGNGLFGYKLVRQGTQIVLIDDR